MDSDHMGSPRSRGGLARGLSENDHARPEASEPRAGPPGISLEGEELRGLCHETVRLGDVGLDDEDEFFEHAGEPGWTSVIHM